MSDTIEFLKLLITYLAISLILIFIFVLYVRNLYKVIQTLKGKSAISIRTVIRAIGVFFPILGIVMGLVKGA